MLKFLIGCFLLVALCFAAPLLALLALLAAPFILLACLGLKAIGFVVGGVIHVAAWIFAVILAITLAILCLPLAIVF